MNLPTLYVGMANPERDAELARAYACATAGDVAARFHCSRSAVRSAKQRHDARRDFDLYLQNGDTPPLRVIVCKVVCCRPFTAVAMAAYRTYPGTLKNLELPGWVLTDGTARCTIADIRTALLSAAKAEKQGAAAVTARRVARERLGMEA